MNYKKSYIVMYFPLARNYSWVNTMLVLPIGEVPDSIVHASHEVGLQLVQDVGVAQQFIVQKLAVGILDVVDRLKYQALVEESANINALKELAREAPRCKGYPDLGRMLMKLQRIFLVKYIDFSWLQCCFASWVNRCETAPSAESIEILREELVSSILWKEINVLEDAQWLQEQGSEWKMWKQEVIKLFASSNLIPCDQRPEQTVKFEVRKRQKLEVRRAEPQTPLIENNGRVSSDNAKAVVPCQQTVELPTCGGTTLLGTRCKYRALPGSTFCKKHGPKEGKKRKRVEQGSSSRGVEMVLRDEAEEPLEVVPLSMRRATHDLGGSDAPEQPSATQEEPADNWIGYACSICLDCFRNRKVLETHVQKRHYAVFSERCMLFQCICCRSNFGNLDELQSHVDSSHKGEDSRQSNGPLQPAAVQNAPEEAHGDAEKLLGPECLEVAEARLEVAEALHSLTVGDSSESLFPQNLSLPVLAETATASELADARNEASDARAEAAKWKAEAAKAKAELAKAKEEVKELKEKAEKAVAAMYQVEKRAAR